MLSSAAIESAPARAPIAANLKGPALMQHDFILLDRSGSMADGNKWSETIAAVNNYVHKLAADKVDTGVILAVFDTKEFRMGSDLDFQIVRDRIIPSTWRDVDAVSEVTPRNWTPLSDAIGRIVSLAKAGNYDKLAIVIVTDGHENSSKELSVMQAKALLDGGRAKGWQVIFIGADFNNIQQAANYGAVSTHTVHSTVANMGATMNMMAAKRADYGSGASASMNYSDDEKKRLAED